MNFGGKGCVIAVMLLLSSITITSGMSAYEKPSKTIYTNNDNTNGWIYDEDNETWSIEFSGHINASFIETFGILEKSEVGIIFSHEYHFSNDSWGYIETSYNHGATWNIKRTFNGDTSDVRDVFVSLTSGSLWVRFTVESKGGNGHWRVWDIDLIGDTRGEPPISLIYVAGDGPIDSEWFSTPIWIRINAVDKLCGIREIHYLLDGVENIVYEREARFTISENGIHHFICWAVDNCGNQEVPHRDYYFKIDSGEYPEVTIIEPAPGIYLFGNRICAAEQNVLFGDFNIEAYAEDQTSGVYKVLFYLGDEKIGESTEAPYECYCALKHSGRVTLKVVAIDVARHCSMDTLDIVYYNFL